MVKKGRFTAAYDGPVAVFIIGMRINKVFAIGKWWPVFLAMGRMLKQLEGDAASGFWASEFALRGWRSPVLIQYWRSFEDLHAYAHDPAREHQGAWRASNKAIGGDGSVGIFHETYLVQQHHHESVYANMPPFGLGVVAGTIPATGSRKDARSRLAGQAPGQA